MKDKPLQELEELDLTLVEEQLTTLRTARPVRSDRAPAQLTILEGVYCHC